MIAARQRLPVPGWSLGGSAALTDPLRCVRRGGVTAYQLDDASGGYWSRLPAPRDQRTVKSVANKWQYRHKLQGNSWEGMGGYYSITPPQLEHGANFGLTAFVTTLYYNILWGRLPLTTENNFRHSDRGPDNMNQTTHAAHVMLVREGAFQKMWWGGGEAGHSHNKQDKYHYDAKCTYYPGAKGKGPGCNAPFDFYNKLEESSRWNQLDGGMKVPPTAYCRSLLTAAHCSLPPAHCSLLPLTAYCRCSTKTSTTIGLSCSRNTSPASSTTMEASAVSTAQTRAASLCDPTSLPDPSRPHVARSLVLRV